MTHESEARQSFANQYFMPEDQLGAEMLLLDRYTQQFPKSQAVLSEVLSDIKRATGIGIPKYKLTGQIDQQAMLAYTGDDNLNYPTIGETLSDSGFSVLLLKMPIERTSEEIKALTNLERRIAGKSDSGGCTIGTMPPETRAMLQGIYELTGATVTRDDRRDGEPRGVVVREAVYQGEAVYFVEDYFDKHPSYDGLNYLQVRIVGKDLAATIKEELTDTEFKLFIETSGIDPFQAHDFLAHNKVTRKNFQDVADVLHQTKDIVDAAEPQVATAVLGDSIDQTFKEAGVMGEDNKSFTINRNLLPTVGLNEDNNIKPIGEFKKSLRAHRIFSFKNKLGKLAARHLGT